MTELEKVEKLRERANVTYEEAKRALDENNGDLLDAMISLEKQGKTKAPKQESFNTTYDNQEEYTSVEKTIEKKQKTDEESLANKIKRFVKIAIQKSKDNHFVVEHKGNQVVKIPAWLFIILLLFGWHVLVPVMIVAMFFSCRYSFVGADDLSVINDVMGKAEDMADKAKEEFTKNDNE